MPADHRRDQVGPGASAPGRHYGGIIGGCGWGHGVSALPTGRLTAGVVGVILGPLVASGTRPAAIYPTPLLCSGLGGIAPNPLHLPGPRIASHLLRQLCVMHCKRARAGVTIFAVSSLSQPLLLVASPSLRVSLSALLFFSPPRLAASPPFRLLFVVCSSSLVPVPRCCVSLFLGPARPARLLEASCPRLVECCLGAGRICVRQPRSLRMSWCSDVEPWRLCRPRRRKTREPASGSDFCMGLGLQLL